MVKIKEGYVMSARERAEFERMDALPRKGSGTVAYYYKPQTKYPPRIYVFMHAEIWCDRNRRPMGLFYSFPFLTRPMNKEELEYHHFNTRLCYHQYEDWNKLLFAEQQEADELDRESPGTGSNFLAKLASFKGRYPLGNSPEAMLSQVSGNGKNDQFLRYLIKDGNRLTASEISRLLRKEQDGEKRLPVLILLRELYKNVVLPETERTIITDTLIIQKVQNSQDRTRRNMARRVYQKNKLFALEEMRIKYPDYSEEMLIYDVTVRKGKPKRAKHPPVTDLRRCQLQKLVYQLERGNLDDKSYHSVCCKIVMLQQAHNLRLPIPLTVTLNRRTEVYSFHWRTRESVVKSFVTMANTKDMTHEALKQKHEEMVSSNYSY